MIQLRTVVQPRASLQVSERTLTIPSTTEGDPEPRIVGIITFRAAARTSAASDVVMTVEAVADLHRLGGPSDKDVVIAFTGTGEGTLDGTLEAHSPVAAGRWTSSGVRDGQLTFTVQGDVGPSGAVVPLRFVLSTP